MANKSNDASVHSKKCTVLQKATSVQKTVKMASASLKQSLSSTQSSCAASTNDSSNSDVIDVDKSSSNIDANVVDTDLGEVEEKVSTEQQLEALQKNWRSLIYGFFKPEVTIQYHEGRLCHFFTCNTRKCKTSVSGVRCYQDSKDKSSTANLKSHVIKCFGEDAVRLSTGAQSPQNGSIFAAFALQGQKPVCVSHCAHTSTELCAHVVRWVTENNWPINIINDQALRELLTAGRPHLSLPGHTTIIRNIKASYTKCRERVMCLLHKQTYPGRLHIAMDTWTSPNHWAMVGWTVHLQHKGEMISFLLDIDELPESHTGVALANAFQKLLERHGIEHKVYTMNADNASANDKQSKSLAVHDNSYEDENHVQCFNHTIQLSAKTLLGPFNPGLLSSASIGSSEENSAEEILEPEDIEDDDSGVDEELCESEDEIGDDGEESNDFTTLGQQEQESLLADSAAVCETVTKLRKLSFAVIHSTTIILLAWRQACVSNKLKPRLIPRDVVTRWNSTYDMLNFAWTYRKPIDKVTADKKLKLRCHELDGKDWLIVQDLLAVLQQYKKATLFFSRDSASVVSVIPAMDKITSTLNPQSKTSYHPAIVTAMGLACKKMDQYYSLTHSSPIYRIAMVLHPGLKLEYFSQHEWEKDWIEQAKDLVFEEFIANYVNKREMNEDTNKASSSVIVPDGDSDNFADIFVGPAQAQSLTHELDQYLQRPVERVKDPLKWWAH